MKQRNRFIVHLTQSSVKIGRIATEDVAIELIVEQSLPVLTYALEVCALNKSDVKSLDYVVDSVVK